MYWLTDRMSKRFETISEEMPRSGVLHAALDRPAAANAINTQMGRELHELFSGLAASPDQVRCVVLSGSGNRAFCAGGDLKERSGMTDDERQKQHKIFEDAFRAVMDCPVPVQGHRQRRLR